MSEEFRSERGKKEDQRNYLRRRFEHYWAKAEMKITDLASALGELRDELPLYMDADHFDVFGTDDDVREETTA